MIAIRVAEKKDFETLFAIHRACLSQQDQMTKKCFFDEFLQPTRIYFVAQDGGKVVGYVGLFDCDSDFNIIGIAVEKSFQHQGIGSALLARAKLQAKMTGKKSLSLEVDTQNQIAQKFYQKHGFVVTNVRKNYYNNCSDALIMFCYL